MAGIARRSCPYCFTQSVAFSAVTEWTANQSRRALFVCGSCNEGIILEWFNSRNTVVELQGDIDSIWNTVVVRQWPEADCGEAPPDCPANVAKFFEQGTASLSAGHFDAAGMMFRKSLDVATKILSPELASKNLVSRIEEMVKGGALTRDLGVWAHEIRLGGNDAAHEEEPFASNDANDLKNFTDNFLRYSFTMPSAVKRRESL